jgi:LSU ribosomal protein L13E
MSEKTIQDILKELKPIVISKGKIKEAKGFSEQELKEVNLTIKEALKLKIPVDIRRKTKYQENVEKLKK